MWRYCAGPHGLVLLLFQVLRGLGAHLHSGNKVVLLFRLTLAGLPASDMVLDEVR